MNDSSWGAPSSGADLTGSSGRAPTPAGASGAASTPEHPVSDGDRPDPGAAGAVSGSGSSGLVDTYGGRGRSEDGGDGAVGGPGDDHAGQPPTSGGAAGVAPTKVRKRAGRDLPAAIGVGVGLGAIILASLFVYKHVFLGVVVAAISVGLWELASRLSERKGIRVPLTALVAGGSATVVSGYVWGPNGAWAAMACTVLAVLLQRMTQSPQEYLRDVSAGVFAAFYVPFLATFVALMLAADDGPWWVLTFLLLTVVSDTGAYAVGWRFGKRKLAPRISPGKTREGLLGAVACAMAAGAVCLEFAVDGASWWQGLVLGLAIAVSATLGDLGESMIKRDLGIKDMGTLLPGHGGIMDRLDSLLPTAPVAWLLFVLFTGG